jgi:hypothetical protein
MAPEFSPLLVGLVLPNISFYVVFCKSLFVSYLMVIDHYTMALDLVNRVLLNYWLP